MDAELIDAERSVAPHTVSDRRADLDEPMALHQRVALRPEPFGALAYHYDTRRLNFLRSHDLVALVESLADHPSPRAAFNASDVDPARWPSFSNALTALAASGFLEQTKTQLSEESA